MEINEIIAVPSPHTPDECPFCPKPKQEPFTTYPGGSAASGTKLGSIMADPPSMEGGARPKDGEANRQGKASPKPRPNPPLTHPDFDRPDGSVILSGPFSYEAHHLIPGKETMLKGEGSGTVMDGHKIEEWIIGGKGKITADSGYTINNSDNGVWLPSAPENLKKLRGRPRTTPWEREGHPKPHPAALTEDEKELLAFYAMEHGAGQFHYGKHAISDETGAYKSYPAEVNKILSELYDRINLWSNECPLCGKAKGNPPPPYDPHWKVHDLLDLVSMLIEIYIRLEPPSRWEFFISTHAMNKSKADRKKLSPAQAPKSF
jgi:hypothetical protein